ncbi:MAG: peptidylprolyl isomerase [Gammaproteobacteria bacterium]
MGLNNWFSKLSPARRKAGMHCTLLLALCQFTPVLFAQQQAKLDEVIAVVNEDVVLKSELDARFDQVQKNIAANPKGPQQPPKDVLRKQILDQLILENLELQLAKRAGVRVDDNMLNEAMSGMAQQYKLTFEQYSKALQQQGLYETAREALRKEIIISQFQRGAVKRRVKISKQEVENYLRSEAGTAAIAPEYHVAHILIPGNPSDSRHAELADQLYKQIQGGTDIRQLAASREILGMAVSGGDLGWGKIDALPSVFAEVVPALDAGQVSKPFTSSNGFHIVKVLESRGGSALKLDQSKVRHILIKPNEIRTEPQSEALIRQLYQRIKNGEDFAEIARRNTEDTASMVSGGDIDWINDGMLPDDEFMSMVHKTPVGALSEPFRSATGWHILQVMDRRVQDATEDNKRNQAMQILGERKMETELLNWETELHDTNYIDIKPNALN